MELLIRSTGSRNVREYHTSEELTDEPYNKVLDTEMDNGGNFTGQLRNVVKALNSQVDGNSIENLTIRPHSIKIAKNSGASWSQVEPGVLRAFESVFGSTKARYARTKVSQSQAKVPA